jgi:hypothetical protein
MHVNLPIQVQLRYLPDLQRLYYLIELRVDAQFGVNSCMNDPSKASWLCNSFRLMIRENGSDKPKISLKAYSHSPMNEMAEMSMMSGEHSVLDVVRPRAMMLHGKEGTSKRIANSVYNPHAYRITEEFTVDPMEKTEKKDKEIEGDYTKEREHMWNKGKIVNKRVEGPYMEWVIDMEPRGSKESIPITPMMQKTFVQTFMFECEERTSQPLGYEFEIIGEVTTSLSGDSSSADEVFEVVQNQPLKFNPGRKRIAAVQRITICVDAYLGAMSVSCYKKGEKPPLMNFGMIGQALNGREWDHVDPNKAGSSSNGNAENSSKALGLDKKTRKS